MRRLQHGMLAMMAVLALAASALAQAQPQPQAPPLVSPEVHSDGRITFRLKAANAQQVFVARSGAERLAMTRDDQGTWTVTTVAVPPDIYQYTFNVDGSNAADRGVAIMSSLPLTDLEAIELPIERQRRVALSAVAHATAPDGRDWRLRVVSVHLENRSGMRRFWARAGASRTRQAEALIDALALSPTAMTHEALPAVVGGDFNVWLGPREDALRLLREAFGTFPSEDTRPTMQNAWRLDYLFPRVPGTVTTTHRRLDALFGSDHYPVVATLDVGGSN